MVGPPCWEVEVLHSRSAGLRRSQGRRSLLLLFPLLILGVSGYHGWPLVVQLLLIGGGVRPRCGALLASADWRPLVEAIEVGPGAQPDRGEEESERHHER